MFKIDNTEFEMLSGTSSMEQLVHNRVPIIITECETLSIDEQRDRIYDLADEIATGIYCVRRVTETTFIFYFFNSVDRTNFINHVDNNQNI